MYVTERVKETAVILLVAALGAVLAVSGAALLFFLLLG
jgi:hypothetical protein